MDVVENEDINERIDEPIVADFEPVSDSTQLGESDAGFDVRFRKCIREAEQLRVLFEQAKQRSGVRHRSLGRLQHL